MEKAVELIEKGDGYFKTQKKKTSVAIMGADYEENVQKFLEMFPAIKGNGGQYFRCSAKNLETNFKWFFENHSYDWVTILQETRNYVNEYALMDYKYMRTSKYFIRKQDSTKMVTSDLADRCELVLAGVKPEEKIIFTEKAT